MKAKELAEQLLKYPNATVCVYIHDPYNIWTEVIGTEFKPDLFIEKGELCQYEDAIKLIDNYNKDDIP